MGLLDRLFGAALMAAPPSTAPSLAGNYEARSEFTLADDLAAGYFGTTVVQGVDVSERSALGVTAWNRGLNIISGTIAGLPLKTYRKEDDGNRVGVRSWLDNPAGPLGMTQAEWVQQVVFYLASGGEVFLLHIYDEAGRIIGAWPVHRTAVTNVVRRGYEKWFEVASADGTKEWLDSQDVTHIMGLSLDGLRGESPIEMFRKGLAFNLAGQDASTNMFTSGFLAKGIVTTEEDVDEEEAKAIKAGLDAKTTGAASASTVAFVNRQLKFTPWMNTAEEAQFIQQRGLGVEEVARMLGIPPHLLAQTDKQTSWGTGVQEQNLGLARYTLRPYTDKLEQALSRLLPQPRFAEFDYKGLLQGTPTDEVKLLLEQVKGGILTKDEARRILNLPPLTPAQKRELKPPAPVVAPPASKEPAND